MSPAENFARGGVRLLALAGADTLLFGSECGDLPALRCLADCLDSPTFADHLTAAPESGLTFAARRQAAAASLLDNATAALLQSPNNTLAVEYLRALRHTRSTMTPCTLRREGAGHDGAPEGDTASASFLRELLRPPVPICPPRRRTSSAVSWPQAALLTAPSVSARYWSASVP